MFRAKSSHKRKRSSARADVSRKLGPSRWNVQILTHTSRAAEKAPARPDPAFYRTVEQHCFNQSLELILPLNDSETEAAEGLPTSIHTLLNQLEAAARSHRSYSAVVPLSLFLDPIFVTAYLRTGSLVALSYNSAKNGPEHQDDDVVCLDGQGTLVLSLCKDTYQTLGLTGRASHFSRKASGRAADRTSGPDTRFIVELPLLSPSFVPGKNGYQQAQRRLRAWDNARAQNRASTQNIPSTHLTGKIASSAGSAPVDSSHATWDMYFVWSPSPETTASVDGQDEIDTAIQFPDSLVDPKKVRQLSLRSEGPTVTDSVWVPSLNSPSHPLSRPWVEPSRHPLQSEPVQSGCTWKDYQLSLQETVEWAGLVSLTSSAVRTFAKPDANCVYSRPDRSLTGRVVKLRWSGNGTQLLLSASFISLVASLVDQHCQAGAHEEKSDTNWAVLSCSGFPHAPLTWRSKVPLSRRFGLKPPSATAQSANDLSDHLSDVSSDDEEAHDMDLESSGDSDSSPSHIHVAPKKGKKSKKSSKRQIGKNETEHAFSPSTGETGWVSFCLPPSSPPNSANSTTTSQSTHWLLVELIGTDVRS